MQAVQGYRKIKRWFTLYPLRRQGAARCLSCQAVKLNACRMNEPGTKIRNGLIKRQDALNRFKVKKEAFLLDREKIRKEIEEARAIWKETLEQLPDQEFKW